MKSKGHNRKPYVMQYCLSRISKLMSVNIRGDSGEWLFATKDRPAQTGCPQRLVSFQQITSVLRTVDNHACDRSEGMDRKH